MPAPTIKVDDLHAQTMQEYGVDKGHFGQETDDEVEQALLARFLFEPPKRQLLAGERNGLALDKVIRQLRGLFTMLTGRPLQLAYSDPAATDNFNLYLPKAMPAPEQPALDLLIYRVMGLVQLGFTRHGLLTERRILAEIHRDWVLRSVYHLLAMRYVLRKWGDEFPGLREDLELIAVVDKAGTMRVNVTEVPRDGMPGAFVPLYDKLVTCLTWKSPGAEGDPARAAIAAVDRHEGPGISAVILGHAQTLREHFKRLRLGPPPLPFYAGIIRPEWILADLSRDVAYEQEWKKGQKPLRQLLEAMAKKGVSAVREAEPDKPRLGLRGLLKAKLQGPDLSKAPAYGAARDEFIEKAKEVRYGAAKWEDGARPEALTDDTPAKPGADGSRSYDEWNDKEGFYTFEAVKVYEPEAPVGPLGSYERIVEANQRQIKEIRRKFAALRVEERWLHGQPDGSEIDLNRAILAFTDIRAGQQPDDRIFKRFVRARQSVAILTMVDTSGSTQGNVIHLEQEAMVLFAEGLRTLDYPHAFYAFGNTHPTECQFHRIKGFDEAYGEAVYKRLSNLRPNGATRMGAFIRHAGWLLSNRPQQRRILMVVSDGKPEDRGDYRGKQGIKDTAMAVQEVRRHGVHVHCISLDPAEDADSYLTEIFGRGRYLKLDDVDSLPARLPEVFRGLVR